MICCCRPTRFARHGEDSSPPSSLLRNARLADRLRHVVAVHRTPGLPGPLECRCPRTSTSGRHRVGVASRPPPSRDKPGGRAIHRPGVQEGQAELLRDAAGRARLARSAGTVDRDHQRGGRGPRAYRCGWGGVAVGHRVDCRVTSRGAGSDPVRAGRSTPGRSSARPARQPPGLDRQRQVADLAGSGSCSMAHVLDVDPRPPDIGEQPRERAGRVGDLDHHLPVRRPRAPRACRGSAGCRRPRGQPGAQGDRVPVTADSSPPLLDRPDQLVQLVADLAELARARPRSWRSGSAPTARGRCRRSGSRPAAPGRPGPGPARRPWSDGRRSAPTSGAAGGTPAPRRRRGRRRPS